jgi:hypothetical protein
MVVSAAFVIPAPVPQDPLGEMEINCTVTLSI